MLALSFLMWNLVALDLSCSAPFAYHFTVCGERWYGCRTLCPPLRNKRSLCPLLSEGGKSGHSDRLFRPRLSDLHPNFSWPRPLRSDCLAPPISRKRKEGAQRQFFKGKAGGTVTIFRDNFFKNGVEGTRAVFGNTFLKGKEGYRCDWIKWEDSLFNLI